MSSDKLTDLLKQNPFLRSFVVGSFSSTFSTLLFQPLDLLKTRMQNVHYLQTSPSIAVDRMGMVSIFSNVIRTESIVGLWRGTVPSLLRSVPGVGLYFTTLHQIQACIVSDSSRGPTATQAILIGLGARAFAASILQPVTVIKTRYESGIFSYKSLSDAFKLTYLRDGLRGLYSGVMPTILRDAPYSGIYYMFYSQLKAWLTTHGTGLIPNSNHLDTLINFSAGFWAGIMASVVTHPADVIKTRMQVDPKRYPDLFGAISLIFKQKGFIGFFIGLTPRLMRRSLMTAFTWTIFEQCIKNLGLK